MINSKKLVIHVIANFMTGGSSQLVMDIFNDLKDCYEQRVLTSYKPDPPAYAGISVTELKHNCSVKSVADYFQTNKPDLVHVHYWGDCDYPWYDKVMDAVGKIGCKVVENINTPIAPYIAPYINRYVYVSQYVLNKFGEATRDKAAVIYPGSDFNFFKREDEPVADDCIGMVYRLEKDKLNEQSIDVFIKVAKRRPQTKVLIIGGGTYLKRYQKAVKEAGVEENFNFTGYVKYDTLPSLYAQMSIFVAPVWKESFGQVSPFAMSFALPVVGYDVGAIDEIIENKSLVAKPGDSGALADIICALLADRKRRIAIGEFNKKRALGNFSVKSMTDAYRQLYQDVLSEPSVLPRALPRIEEKKRIVFFVHCFFPDHIYGTEVYTYKIAKNLQENGYDPVIVTAKFPGENKEEQFITYYEYEGLPVFCIDKNYLPHRRIKDTYYQEEMREVLRGILKDLEPNLVHVTHIINHTAVLFEVLEELKIPRVATLTDFFGHCFNNKLQSFDGSLCFGPNDKRTNCLLCLHAARVQNNTAVSLEKLVINNPWLASTERAAGRVLANRVLQKGIGKLAGVASDNLADNINDVVNRPDILKECYAKLQRAIVPTKFTERMYVHNGLSIPLHRITFGVDIAFKAKAAKTQESPVTIGYIGQLDYHKGTDILINSFKAAKNHHKARLLIYGSEIQAPKYVERLKTMISGGDEIYFKGTFPQDKLPDILAEIDVLVIPSRWHENSPLILLSALASHTPVVVSNVEGMTEFIFEGKSGFSFEINDVEQLQAIIERLIDDPAILQNMKNSTCYDKNSKQMTMEIIEVYEKVLQEE